MGTYRLVVGYMEAQKIVEQEASKAGVSKVFTALHSRGVLLCRAAQFEELGEKFGNLTTQCPTSAAAAAAALEQFEAQVRIERLSETFLQQRKKWIEMLRAGRGSFDAIVNLAWDL